MVNTSVKRPKGSIEGMNVVGEDLVNFKAEWQGDKKEKSEGPDHLLL